MWRGDAQPKPKGNCGKTRRLDAWVLRAIVETMQFIRNLMSFSTKLWKFLVVERTKLIFVIFDLSKIHAFSGCKNGASDMIFELIEEFWFEIIGLIKHFVKSNIKIISKKNENLLTPICDRIMELYNQVLVRFAYRWFWISSWDDAPFLLDDAPFLLDDALLF